MPCQTVTVEPSTEQMVGFESYSFEPGQNQVTISYTVYNDSSDNVKVTVRRTVGDTVDDKDEAVFAGSTSSATTTFDVPVDQPTDVQCCVDIVDVR